MPSDRDVEMVDLNQRRGSGRSYCWLRRERRPSVKNAGEPDGSNEEALSELPDEHPSCLPESTNDGSDQWFQYRGQLLFSREETIDIANRLVLISGEDFEAVETTETSINWWETTDFINEVEQQWANVTDSHSFLVSIPTPDIEQQYEPRRAKITVDYSRPQDNQVETEQDWKREQILSVLREYDYWVYETQVIRPALEAVGQSDAETGFFTRSELEVYQ